MVESKIEGVEELKIKLSKLPEGLRRRAVVIINKNALELQKYIRTERLSGGTTADRLAVRSGNLRASIGLLKTQMTEDGVEGGVSLGGGSALWSDPHRPKRTGDYYSTQKGKVSDYSFGCGKGW